MLAQEQAFKIAVGNIARWGDTDVFPFAPENHVLHDQRSDVVALLKEIDTNLREALIKQPPHVENALSLVTYEGFRNVSQIDPIWNAYFLGIVLRVAPEIEDARLEKASKTVFSYRINIDKETDSLFESAAWNQFSEASQKVAQEYEYVAICDIADFYGRIYHHRIKNSLSLVVNQGSDIPDKIDRLLMGFSDGVSYGLPVGGPAARILSELLLNRVDRLLVSQGIRFCRYADDYRLFATSREEAFRSLVFLTSILQRHEGLTLQRHKTKVLSTKDFLRTPLLLPEDSDDLSLRERQERRLLKLSLRYDPYSNTAEDDYERLRDDVEQFDVLGMLTNEVAKSRVNTPVVKKLAQIIRHFQPDVRDAAAEMLVKNLDVLAPALPVVLRVLENLLPDLSEPLGKMVAVEIRRTISTKQYWVMVPVNLAYALRILRHDRSEENITLCAGLYGSVPPFIQRDIVYLMYGWQAHHWLSDLRRQWIKQHAWVQRALLLASYALGDEGNHWRKSVSGGLNGLDEVARQWMEQRVRDGRRELPF